ncbi:hypothetical protein D6D28_09168 [Aureobasidium pullulans]|uniref:Uncharacterized protein n=1 Tax=Aureobasidium pullulans TaxID=5580 RepID=A0A4S8S5C4_AURPU|nr:hypothetical protein D6D28_09168 [Aureobasidium pullulans]
MCQIWTGFVKSYSRTHATDYLSIPASFFPLFSNSKRYRVQGSRVRAGRCRERSLQGQKAGVCAEVLSRDSERPGTSTTQKAAIEALKKLENLRRWRDEHRDEHVNNYLNDAAYREAYQKGNKHNKASDEKKQWARRMAWETHELLYNETGKTPGLCASCKSVYTRKFWWQRKKSDEKSGEKLLDCHNCFCHKDWEKAMPIGMRGHVFGTGRIRQPDWTKYPPPSSSKS